MESKKEIFFSVIIPAYNVDKYLMSCVQSVLQQNFYNYEIILVDDGSMDGTRLVCDSLMQRNEQIKVKHKKNGGLSSARNTGIRLANGKYLIFLDGDDELSENALTNLHESITRWNNPDICIGRFDVIGEGCHSFAVKDYAIESNGVDYFNREDFLFYLLSHRYLHSACKLIIRNDFLKKEELWFRTGLYHEDELWTSSVFVKATSLCICNEPFYRYKLRHNSIMTTRNIKKIMDRLKVAEELQSLAVAFSEHLIEKQYLDDRAAILIYSAFSEVLPYEKRDVYCVIDKIEKLTEIDAKIISKMKIYPMATAIGFRRSFQVYYLYYRIKRKFIIHR